MSETFTFSALVEPVSIEEEPARVSKTSLSSKRARASDELDGSSIRNSGNFSSADSFKSRLLGLSNPSIWEGFGAKRERIKFEEDDVIITEDLEGPGVEQTEVQREAQGNKPEERYGPWLQVSYNKRGPDYRYGRKGAGNLGFNHTGSQGHTLGASSSRRPGNKATIPRWTTVTNGKKASEGNQNKHSSANDGGKHVGSRFDILANAEGTGEEIGRDNRSISEAVDGSLHSRGAGSVGQNSSMRAKGSNTEVLKDVTNKGGRTRSPAISKKNPASGSKGKGLTAAKATIKTKMQAQREIPRHKGKAQLGGDPERAKEYKIHDEDGEETDALKQLHRDVLAFSQGIRIKHFEDASCGQQTKCTSTDPVNNDIEQSMKIDVKSTTFDEAASLLKEAMVTATE
ncbi:hypothetical protein ACOSQ3_019223 [Xanthoceras sorbifolium]